MKKRFLLGIVLLLTSGYISAQSFYIGPIVGYNKGTNMDATSTISGALRIGIASFGVEASVGYTSSKFTDNDLKTTSYPIMLTFQMHFLPILYGQAGIGWYNTKLDFSGPLNTAGYADKTDSKVGYHIGFGAEVPLGNILLTGDIKYVFLDYNLGSVIGIRDTKANYTLISAGLLFKL